MKLDIPYVPSSEDRLMTMMNLAGVKPGEKAADLGCGDGRVVIALAARGARVNGFELEPRRAQLSELNVLRANMEDNATIYNKSFWDVDFRDYDLITLYGISSMMGRLEEKLKTELKTGSRVVSNFFTFPTWDYVKAENDVYLYVKE